MSAPRSAPPHPTLLLVASTLGLTAAFFHRVLATGDTFGARDSLYVYFPVFQAWARSVRAGRLPEWLTLDGLGQPFAGMLVVAPLHPSKLLYPLLPLDTAFTVNILACFPVALLGVHVLARLWNLPRAGAFLAGLAYAFSGYLVCITNNLCYLMAASTLPWALWAAVRYLRAPGAGRLLAAGSLLALVLYAGDVQAFSVTCGLLPLLALTESGGRPRARILSVVGVLAVTVLLAAPQLLSSLSLLGLSEAGADSLASAQDYALHPLRLLEPLLGSYLMLPGREAWVPMDVVTHVVPSGFAGLWVDSIHLGAPALLLAGVALWSHRRARPTWLWAGVWLLLLGLALGAALPLYEALYTVFPPWKLFRYPSKLVPFLLLGLSLAAAFGWREVFLDVESGRRAFARLALGVTAFCLLLAALESVGGAFTQGLLQPRWPSMPPDVAEGLSQRFVTVTVLAALWSATCWVATRPAVSAAWRTRVLLATQLIVSGVASEPLYELITPEVLTTPPPLVEPILSEPPSATGIPVRVASHADVARVADDASGLDARQLRSVGMVRGLMPDTPGLWGLESAEAQLPAASKRARRLTSNLTRWFIDLAPLFSVAYSVHPLGEWAPLEAAGKKWVAADPAIQSVLVGHPGALPRVFLSAPRCVDSAETALGLLTDPEVRRGHIALVECGALADALTTKGGGPVDGQVRVTRYDPESLEFEVASRSDAVLIINDAWFPGWSATVDGTPVAVLPANAAVRAVPVKAGAWHVSLTYRDRGLRLGLGLTALTFVVLLLLTWRSRRRLAAD